VLLLDEPSMGLAPMVISQIFKIIAEIKPGNPVEAVQAAGKFFRQMGVQSRPIHAHGIDLITDGPHVFCEHVDAEPFERTFKPGMVFMA